MYIDAIFDRNKDEIKVVERINGKRVYNTLPAEHVFYYEHNGGSYRSIFGDTLKRFSTNNGRKFKGKLMEIGAPTDAKGRPRTPKRIFESDINPIFRVLASNYMGAETPKLQIGYFDIETEFNLERGFAPTTDPFNPINAISVYQGWTNEMITMLLCPPKDPVTGVGYTYEEADALAAKFSKTTVYRTEAELLRAFVEAIEDADILTGWNSEGYDIPYIVNRMKRILGENSIRDLCLWNQNPREREYEKFKKKHKTYDLVGRVHLDYLLLYQKHNPAQLHSYRLDYVGEIEVNENKIPYEGTLDDLYKKDYEKFIAYNRQDTELLYKIDQKKKFIELSNQVAHANCVLLKTTMGSVALVEQAIINEMHAMGFVVPDRKRTVEERDGTYQEDEDEDDEGRTPVVGAYVAVPKKGLRSEVACADINSLYPSTIRALNMSPETIVGQMRSDETMALVAKRIGEGIPRAEAWDGLFYTLEYGHMIDQDEHPVTIDFVNGNTQTMTGADWYEYIFNPANNLCITANGTIFSTEKDGMIPMLLAKWYADRKAMQAKAKEWGDKAKKDGLNEDDKKEAKYWNGYWDQRQQARKILLNSLYGALLNEGLRFYDERLGQSVTLTGRSIVRHMNAKINESITGEYDYRGKAIVYADTDSCYFSAYEAWHGTELFDQHDWTRESTILLYDTIADIANESFPQFMASSFNTTLERGGIIAAGRELVASKALFIKKKKYACLMYDKEGDRLDVGGKPGKLKAMGLDLKRADTPKEMQKFLEKVLLDLLTDVPQQAIFDQIRTFRTEFVALDGWKKGTPKGVKALADYADRENKTIRNATNFKAKNLAVAKGEGKINMPGHVRAALNWNDMLDIFEDRYSMRIGDGAKVIVCKLKKNVFAMDSIAYPIDEPHLPAWFKDLPFDHRLMEETIIDNKLENLVGVLDWDLEDTKEKPGEEFFVF